MLIDLSHDVAHGMITYRGLPGPVISEHLSREASRAHYALGTEFHIGRIDMVANTGTYLDSPFHRYAGGKDLSELPLSSVADLPGVVVRAPHARGRAVGPELLRGLEPGKRYRVTDYANNIDFGIISGSQPTLNRAFAGSLLLEVAPKE